MVNRNRRGNRELENHLCAKPLSYPMLVFRNNQFCSFVSVFCSLSKPRMKPLKQRCIHPSTGSEAVFPECGANYSFPRLQTSFTKSKSSARKRRWCCGVL